MKPPPWYRRWLRLPQRSWLILIAALFFSLSFEPSPFWFLAYFFVPLFAAAIRGLGFKEGFRAGYLFGVVTAFLTLYWVSYVTIVGVILLILVHSLYYAFIAGIVGLATQRYGRPGLLLLPFLWVAVEYLRSLTQISFPWQNLSYTQASNLAIVQLAELSGDAVVTFFVLAVGLLLYVAYRSVRSPWRAAGWFGLVLIVYTAAYIWGATRFESLEPDFKVAALQGNIPVAEKWRQGSADHNFEIYENLTNRAAQDSIDLVVWPETAAPMYLIYQPPYVKWIESIARRNNVDLVTGALHMDRDQDGERHYYNAAFFFKPEDGRQPEIYRKHHLVTFGEHMPYAESVDLISDFRDFVKNNLALDISDFEPGENDFLWESNGRFFVPLICFEIIYPDYVRKMVNRGADFLNVITNDDWFGHTAGPYQHAAIPIFRAVENRIWIVRAANTGITVVYDPFGRMKHATSLGERTYISAEIGPRLEPTLFSRYGRFLSQICLVISLAAAILLVIQRGKSDRA